MVLCFSQNVILVTKIQDFHGCVPLVNCIDQIFDIGFCKKTPTCFPFALLFLYSPARIACEKKLKA